MMSEGRYKFEKALKIYKKCEESGEWPNREVTIQKLSYPGWYNMTQEADQLPQEDSDDLF